MPMEVDPASWVRFVEIPVAAGLFWMIHGLRQDFLNRSDRIDERGAEALTRTREDLADYKLEVARTYVPLSLMRDVDRRLSEHMLRIESKITEFGRSCASCPISKKDAR
jgi:hypothetical protein